MTPPSFSKENRASECLPTLLMSCALSQEALTLSVARDFKASYDKLYPFPAAAAASNSNAASSTRFGNADLAQR